ncbi:unnamed protein product [Didymodactylos carnosus]|uniref:Wax synthase domain-containing protein n=1 Tax=Didymodactylos carnosus TaxID=1234261 RepID=A0A816B869_9BILA|nr:unnamed protein product [Didymodactylos carnosus]CAF4487166.1 unnamed protein product [Didymodactylos carnosus]
MTCSIYWMVSIRLIHLMLLPHSQRHALTLKYFLYKFVWFVLPVSRNTKAQRSPFELFLHVTYHLLLAVGKLFVTDVIYYWLLQCLERIGGGDALKENYFLTIQYIAIFYVSVCCGTFLNDAQIALISLITLDKYEVLPFNDWPVLSLTPREFWGKRYNKLVSHLLRESVFEPLRNQFHLSSSYAALGAFIVSGMLHLHVAKVGFNGNMFAALLFFVLQGVACTLEVRFDMKKLPKIVSMFLTQTVLLVTSPLYLGLFIYASPTFLQNNPPDFRLPFQIPVPDYCPS